MVYDGEKLSKQIRTKRLITLEMNIRDAAKEMGISAATLSRIENKRPPDIDTFATLCNWVEQPMELFFKLQKNKK